MPPSSHIPFLKRAEMHAHPVARLPFQIAEAKKSNLVISADFTDTKSLLACADTLGPYIAVFKTHIDIVTDFGENTVQGLKELSEKHQFLIFEDRKLMDIGSTAQKQYHGGVLRISEWADIVNLSILSGEGIVEAMEHTLKAPDFPHREKRAFLLLAEMTSKGSMATGSYTQRCVDLACKFPSTVIGFVATRSLEDLPRANASGQEEDFVVFSTGINMDSKGDSLGQQYQTPSCAVGRGADFIIAGRGIYASSNPIEAAKRYQTAGWEAYLQRTRLGLVEGA